MSKASAQRSSRPGIVLTGICALWGLAVCAGLVVLWNYSNEPGAASDPPVRWPAASSIQPESGKATLLMFAHPRCPCTRASVGELALIMRHCIGKVSVHVLFYDPESSSGGWERTDLWRSADAIPSVHVHKDPDGATARLFGATTSGAVVVYDAKGELLFKGGVTGGRGHSGDNAGRSSVVALINGELSEHRETFVYGCPIFDETTGETSDEMAACCQEEPR